MLHSKEYFFHLGARVLLACRDITKAERTAEEIRKLTKNKEVVVYILDLASLKSVRRCAGEILEKEPRLDVLINNAGQLDHCKAVFVLVISTVLLGYSECKQTEPLFCDR